MPGRDGTGPRGLGPMTGGGRGFCAMPVVGMGPRFGRRFFGRGGGRVRGWARAGYGFSYPAELTEKEEAGILKEEAVFLREQLDGIQNRLSALEETQRGR